MLAAALLIARLGLAAVFSIAGVAKLADRNGARKAAVDFGAPEALAGPLAIALPVAELAVAALLLPESTARWGALGALGLLLVFSTAIAVALARGRAPDCHCFGQIHSEPAGWKALARNGALAALAAFVLAAGWSDPGPGALGWIGRLDGTQGVALAAGVVTLAVLAGAGWAVLHVLREYGRVLVRVDRMERALVDAGFSIDEPETGMPSIGHNPGTEAPPLALSSVDGDTVTLDTLLEPGRPLLLLFTSPTCGPCAALLPKVAAWQREHAEALTIALVSGGAPDAVRAEALEHGLAHVLLDEELVVYEDYAANGTPSAVLVSPDREIASWVASGSEWIERLVDDTLTGEDAETEFGEGLPVGSAIPDLALADLGGTRVDLTALSGTETVLLFWNPDCGHCRAMHEDLLAWEADPPSGSPELVVVSSGDARLTSEERFSSRVVLDREFEAGTAFFAGGTPMAVRLDAEGKIASPLAAGAGAVLRLLGTSRAAAPS